ncbi:MAG: hypothetical protein LUH58_04645 [Lachnospiraceae bacterium]|nr:hypothetical protein [Lachnospiraceae bacterium]
MNSEDPVEWIKVVKDEYLRSNDKTARRLPTQEEKEIANKTKHKLYLELARALNILEEEVEAFIHKKVSEDW